MTTLVKWTAALCLYLCIAFSAIISAAEKDQELANPEQLPLEELRIFAEVYNRIKSSYVEEVDDRQLIKGAIAGMLSSLDPHSSYLDKEAFDNIQNSSLGQYGGLGIEVIPENNGIKIITPIDNSPAKREGILAGDVIIRINNTPLRNVKAEETLELMRGEVGESVHLTIRRKGSSELLEFDLVREIIKLSSIRSKWLGNGMVYLRIIQFQRRSSYDLTQAIEKIREEHGGKINGLILDMRNNPGGVLIAAEEIADLFLNQGLVVSTRGKMQSANYQFHASQGDLLYGAPIVVLINSGTASAAEIVAGALQDHNRAIIMGTRSFGKGSVQTVMPITDQAALKLTTSRYYTPSGRSIQGTGIKPDLEVQQRDLSVIDTHDNEIYESDLKGSLKSDSQETSTAELIEDKAVEEREIKSLIANDFQLAEAVNLLRGISILSLKSKYKNNQPLPVNN